MRTSIRLAALLALAAPAQAADLEAARVRVQTVCAACHGANGVSVSDAVPHLAAQRAAYLEAQLAALKDGSRKHPAMNAIAAQLGDDEITNLAAYYAAQPGAAPGARSAQLPHVAKSGVRFPGPDRAAFTRYHVIDLPEAGQVTHYLANAVALEAAKAGRPLPDGSVIYAAIHSARRGADRQPLVGTDGHLVPDTLLNVAVMAREAGWGRELPELLRNGDWNYAVFTADGQRRDTVNQAECLACHKPLAQTSHVFTFDPLTATAKAR